jgi:hypothetical protein
LGDRQPRDVAAWLGEAGDQPPPNRVYDTKHDDGYRARGLFERPDLGSTMGNDEVGLEPHELSRERRGSLVLALRIPAFDDEVLALDIPALTQPLHERLPITGLCGRCGCR